jgi:hypothetical protein
MTLMPKLILIAAFAVPVLLIALLVKGFILQAVLAVAAFYGVDYALRHTGLGERIGYS